MVATSWKMLMKTEFSQLKQWKWWASLKSNNDCLLFCQLFCFWDMWISSLASQRTTMIRQWVYEMLR
jgi:hypothetical protein